MLIIGAVRSTKSLLTVRVHSAVPASNLMLATDVGRPIGLDEAVAKGTVTSAAAQERLGNVVKKPGFLGQSAVDVARTAVTQLFRRKALIIPGWHNKLTYVLWNVLPRMVAERIVVALFDRRPRTNWSLRRLAVPRPSFALMLR